MLVLIATRPSEAEVAQALGISRRTVQKHLEHAYRKLGAASRAEAVALLSGVVAATLSAAGPPT